VRKDQDGKEEGLAGLRGEAPSGQEWSRCGVVWCIVLVLYGVLRKELEDGGGGGGPEMEGFINVEKKWKTSGRNHRSGVNGK
jgi:hypothetical protein